MGRKIYLCPSVVAGRGERGEVRGRGEEGGDQGWGLGWGGKGSGTRELGATGSQVQEGREQGTDRQKRGRCGPSVAARGRNCTYDAEMQTKGDFLPIGTEHMMNTHKA